MTSALKKLSIGHVDRVVKKNAQLITPLLIVFIIIFGITLRIVNLDGKLQSYDETFPSLRISGYSVAELTQNFSNNQVVSFEDFQQYQIPSTEKNFLATINSLALEEPQHPPLYFLLARLWTSWLGLDIATLRLLSALFSIACIPLAYWLARELFQSSVVSLFASAIFAISPFHLIYAQEAREYSLWFVLTLVSSLLLLRAIRFKSKPSWLAYGTCVAASMYTFPFALLTILSHGIYLLVLERFRITRRLVGFFLASTLGLVVFIPWLLKLAAYYSLASESSTTTHWMFNRLSLAGYLIRWAGNFSRLFLDTGYNGGEPINHWMALIPLVVLIILWSLVYVCQNSQKSSWLFIVILTFVPFICLVLHDLIIGARLSTIPRYLIPVFIGLQIAVAFLLGHQFRILANLGLWKFRLWALVLVFLVFSGLISSLVISSQEIWWHQGPFEHLTYRYHLREIMLRNKADLLIHAINNDADVGETIMLSRRLGPEIDTQLLFEPDSLSVPSENYDSIFLFTSESDLQKYQSVIEQQGYYVERVNVIENKTFLNGDKQLFALIKMR